MDLKLLQRELNSTFYSLNQSGSIEKPMDKIKAGDLCLYQNHKSLQVFRARILQVDGMVSFRLIDFGICLVVQKDKFYEFSKDQFEGFYSLPPFVSRVNLPTDEVLSGLNLPVSSMIKEGDVLNMILLSTTEPHLVVFSFARGKSHRFTPEKFTDGFDQEERKNWMALFDKNSMLDDPLILSHGFGHLSGRTFHSNRLALVAYLKALDKIYVHDLESSIRMKFLREKLESIYGNEKIRLQLTTKLSELSVGVGCVAYHKASKLYVRVEVIAMGVKEVEVAPVDMPNLGNFTVESVFKVPKSLQFPRQCFSVRMTRHSDGQHRHYFSKLARCVLPDKTPVVLNSEPEFGLVDIGCSNAPHGVLAKIGFTALKHSKFDDRAEITVKTFGRQGKVVASQIENIQDFTEKMIEEKKVEPKKIRVASSVQSSKSGVSCMSVESIAEEEVIQVV